MAEDTYESDATDFAAQIAKIKALPEQPAFYYVAAMPGNIGIVVKQMRDAGLTGPIVGGDGYDTPDLPAIAGPAANDVYFTTHALMDANGGTEPIKAFMAAYEAKFGHPVENAFAALGYDTVYLLKDAIERAGSMDGAGPQERHRDARRTSRASPGRSPSSPDSHVPQKGVTVIEVVDQVFTLAPRSCPRRSRPRSDPGSSRAHLPQRTRPALRTSGRGSTFVHDRLGPVQGVPRSLVSARHEPVSHEPLSVSRCRAPRGPGPGA